MPKVTVPTYERDLNRALTQVVNNVRSTTQTKRQRLERELRGLNKRFYTILARRIVGSAAPPNLGSYTPPPWKPLSPKTIARKGHGAYYRDTGVLERWLNSADADVNIGEPEVVVQQGGTVGTVKGKVKEFVRVSSTGKKWVQRVGIGPNGRFVSTKELQRELKPALIAYPFGQRNAAFVGGTTAKLLAGGDPIVAYKLTNAKGEEQRPIASYYLAWWLNVMTRRVVEKYQ